MAVNPGIYTKPQIARGTGVAPPPPSTPLAAPIEIFGVRSTATTNAQAPTQAEYTSGGMTYPSTGISYAFNSGYHYFTVGPGTFTVIIKGAEGSGTEHGYGAYITATMVATAAVRMVALVGTAGTGSYSGGGGTFLAYSSGPDTYVGATAILVAGGGGGGYSAVNPPQRDAGDTTWSPTTQRKNNTDCATNNGGVYDGGASFSNPFTVGAYSCTVSASAAQNFIAGGKGGQATSCGSGTGNEGGFGGGGGSCPAGGGGYYGGAPGGNSPTNYGGGGGTSYRAVTGSVTITAWSDTGLNGSSRSANPGTTHGYLKITYVS